MLGLGGKGGGVGWGVTWVVFFFLLLISLITFEHSINVREGGWSIKDKYLQIWEIRIWVKERERDSNFYHRKEKQNSASCVCGAAATSQLTQTTWPITVNTAWAQPLRHHLQTNRGRFELSSTSTKKGELICRLNVFCCTRMSSFFFLVCLSLPYLNCELLKHAKKFFSLSICIDREVFFSWKWLPLN